MRKLDARLIRMINHSKGQFASVTVIIAVALCIYMLFNMTRININEGVDDYYKLANINAIQVQLVRVPESALGQLRRLEGIREVEGRLSFDVPVKAENPDEKVTIRLISTPPKGQRINRLYWLRGIEKVPENNDVVLLQQFSDARAIKPGDRLTTVINGTTRELRVSGVAASAEFIYLMENEQTLMPAPERFGVGYVSEAYARSVYGFGSGYNEILINTTTDSNVDDVITRVEKSLDPYGVKRITKLEDQLSNFVLVQKMEGVEKMQVVMPVLFLTVAAIVIVIMLSRTVSNDRVAIGVLKGLGYGNGSILMHYSKYALAMGAIGGSVGIAGGLILSGPMSRMFVSYFNIPVVRINIYPAFILSALFLTAIFCVCSGLLGARAVLRIAPSDAMRPEPPRSGKRVFIERIPLVWKNLSAGWKMVIRNVMRTKRRFIFLVIGLALSYAINTVPMYQSNAMQSMFELQYGVYQKMDYTIALSNPRDKTVVTEIKELVDVKAIEPKLEYPFELKHGWLDKNVIVIGVPRDTEFYEFRGMDDREIKLSPGGILLTEMLAKTLQVQPGDYLTIRNFLPGREDVSVRVSGIVRQYLGSNAYMDLTSMQKLLMDDDVVNGANLLTNDDVKGKLKDISGIASIQTIQELKDSFLEFLDTMILVTRLYMIFGGILGFALIYNATLIGIMERSQEFSAMRIMGYDIRTIFGIIGRENLLMASVAILLGIPMGIGMMNAMAGAFSSDMITFPRLFPSWIFLQAAVATALFVALAQVSTYRKIRDLNFIDVLKSWIS